MKKQVYNPFLPLDVCIPDGEPHVFGDRLYLFGSHEKEGDTKFCSLDYEFFSCPIDDLTDWTSKGINYSAKQDPFYGKKYKYMYAPDIVRGNDGKFYLYYAMSGGCFTGPFHVAVCDTPDGKYEYYGEVKNIDGSTFQRNITFDPGVINDNGIIRFYYGWSLAIDKNDSADKLAAVDFKKNLVDIQMIIFDKTREEIEREPEGIMGAFTVELADDMLTVTTEPKRIVVGQFDSIGTEFEGHAFFEGSSIRRIGATYYFIYSTENQHELAYATSKLPDKDFHYGGIIVSNGDIGLMGRISKDRLAATGNNHGSIEYIDGQWYVFYHRHTHNTTFSRQACAEKITINEDGTILQAEMTSCALNGGALRAEGSYPAVICCNLTNGNMTHLDAQRPKADDIPFITHCGNERFITQISDGTLIGYKYFAFEVKTNIALMIRGCGGEIELSVADVKSKRLLNESAVWQEINFSVDAKGDYPLYIQYIGEGKIDLLELKFSHV